MFTFGLFLAEHTIADKETKDEGTVSSTVVDPELDRQAELQALQVIELLKV